MKKQTYSLKNPPPNIEEAKQYILKNSVRQGKCRVWTAGLLKKRGGYGYAYWPRYSRSFGTPSGPTSLRAHRMSWVLWRGPLTEVEHVLHTCDNPACINPNHLFLGDQPINMADKVTKLRQNRGMTHGMVKLTEKQVLFIRKSKEKQKPLAERFGVSAVTISDIRRRRSWKHI